MAFNITTEPIAISPVYNHLTYVVNDTDYTEPKFKYVFEVYVDGSLKNTSKLYPRLDGTCQFSAHKIIQQYISYERNYDITTLTSGTANEIVDWYIKFKVEYEVAGVLTSYLRTTGSSKIVWNSVAQWEDAKNLTTFVEKYTPENVSFTPDTMFLNWPYIPDGLDDAILLDINDKRTLSYLPKTIAGSYFLDELRIITYDATKTPSKEYSYEAPAPTTTVDYITHFPLGISELNNIVWTGTNIPSGLSSDININEDSYLSVELLTSDPYYAFKPLRFKLYDSSVCKYDHYTISYQTPLGGFGYINADKKHFKSLKSEKIIYDKVLPYNYDDDSRVTTVYGNLANESITLNTDWLQHQGEIEQIRDLLNSPTIFIIDNNGVTIPVYIDSSTYTINNLNQDGLIQYKFTFKEAFQKNTII